MALEKIHRRSVSLYGALIQLPEGWVDQTNYLFVPEGEGKRKLTFSRESMDPRGAVGMLKNSRRQVMEQLNLKDVTEVVARPSGVGAAYGFSMYFGNGPDAAAVSMAAIELDDHVLGVQLRTVRSEIPGLGSALASLTQRKHSLLSPDPARPRRGVRYPIYDLEFEWEGGLKTPRQFRFATTAQGSQLEANWRADAPGPQPLNWNTSFVLAPESALGPVSTEFGAVRGGQVQPPFQVDPTALRWQQAGYQLLASDGTADQELFEGRGYVAIGGRFLVMRYRGQDVDGRAIWHDLLSGTHGEV